MQTCLVGSFIPLRIAHLVHQGLANDGLNRPSPLIMEYTMRSEILVPAVLVACASFSLGLSTPPVAAGNCTGVVVEILDPNLPPETTIECRNPCHWFWDDCETWDNSPTGEGCRCEDTIQPYCCDVYLDSNDDPVASGWCATLSCTEAGSCQLVTVTFPDEYSATTAKCKPLPL